MESWLEWEIPHLTPHLYCRFCGQGLELVCSDCEIWEVAIRFEVLQGKPVVPTIEFYTTVTATEMVYTLYGTDGM